MCVTLGYKADIMHSVQEMARTIGVENVVRDDGEPVSMAEGDEECLCCVDKDKTAEKLGCRVLNLLHYEGYLGCDYVFVPKDANDDQVKEILQPFKATKTKHGWAWSR